MRTRKIFGLLIPLLQLLLLLKLIEYVRGYSISGIVANQTARIEYVTSVPVRENQAARSAFITDFPNHKRKLKPYWTTTPEPEVVDQIITYDTNGTVVERKNVTRRISAEKPTRAPLCPDKSVSRQQQNIRQSTLPMLIILLIGGAWIVAFKTFLLLWKVNYYKVEDPYATSGPVPIADNFFRSFDNTIFKDDPDNSTIISTDRNSTRGSPHPVEAEVKKATPNSKDVWITLIRLAFEKFKNSFLG